MSRVTGATPTRSLTPINPQDEMRRLLEELQLEDCVEKFKEEMIDFDMLSELSDSDMTSLGVKTIGQRMKLRNAAKERKGNQMQKRDLNPLELNKEDVHLGKLMGRGKFGTVYSCTYSPNKGLYAVKVIQMSEDKAESFKKEVEILSQVNHKNVVSLFGYFVSNERMHLVMDLMESSLRNEMVKRREQLGSWWSLAEVTSFVVQIVEGISHLHSLNIAHRDIKVSFVPFLSFCDELTNLSE